MIISIPEIVKKIAKTLQNNGNQAFIVGGFIRDTVMKKESKDIDIATDLFVDSVIVLFKDEDFILDIKKTGDKFPVARIFTTTGEEFEIATFRSESGNGKDTEFKIVSDIKEDVNRRDFTFNALFADAFTGEVFDLVNGISDLENKIIRFVGDPVKRIEEDRTRLLRLVRFKERFEFQIDNFELIKSNSILIEGLTEKEQVKKEMIVTEIIKGFDQAKDKISFFDTLFELNILQQAFLGCEIIKPLKSFDSIQLMLFQILSTNDLDKIILIMQEMTWSTDMINKVKCLFQLRDQNFSLPGSLARLVKLIDSTESRFILNDLSLLIEKNVLKFKDFKLSVKNTDFSDIKPGPELGVLIHQKELSILNGKD